MIKLEHIGDSSCTRTPLVIWCQRDIGCPNYVLCTLKDQAHADDQQRAVPAEDAC